MLLRSVVGAFEAAFPGRVRGYYLAGSYAEGTSTPTSDVDIDIIFRADGRRVRHEGLRSAQLLNSLIAISPIELNAGCTWERELLASVAPDAVVDDGSIPRRVYLKLAKPLLYGQDIRDRVTLPSLEAWTHWLFQDVLWYMGQLREGAWELSYPLAYPAPGGEFFGYDGTSRRGRDGTMYRSTRGLVRTVHQAACALIALRSDHYVVRKDEVARSYREAVGDEWSAHIEEVDRVCRVENDYLVPLDHRARHRLRDVCGASLAFENYVIDVARVHARKVVETRLHSTGG